MRNKDNRMTNTWSLYHWENYTVVHRFVKMCVIYCKTCSAVSHTETDMHETQFTVITYVQVVLFIQKNKKCIIKNACTSTIDMNPTNPTENKPPFFSAELGHRHWCQSHTPGITSLVSVHSLFGQRLNLIQTFYVCARICFGGSQSLEPFLKKMVGT